MTDAEINRKLAEMEGECGHRNATLECGGTMSSCSDDTCPHIAWVCWDCESSSCCCEPFQYPDRLNDPAYILGLMIKLLLAHRDAGFTIRSRYFYYNRPGDHNDRTIPTFSVLIKDVFSVETLKRAIAQAAIQKEGEK